MDGAAVAQPATSGQKHELAGMSATAGTEGKRFRGTLSSSEDSADAGLSDGEGGQVTEGREDEGEGGAGLWGAAGNAAEVGDAGVGDVLRARASRVKKLLRIYENEYWGLAGELHGKHARFAARTGRSGASVEEGGGNAAGAAAASKGAPARTCAAEQCRGRPLELSDYCLGHILQDQNQCLYGEGKLSVG